MAKKSPASRLAKRARNETDFTKKIKARMDNARNRCRQKLREIMTPEEIKLYDSGFAAGYPIKKNPEFQKLLKRTREMSDKIQNRLDRRNMTNIIQKALNAALLDRNNPHERTLRSLVHKIFQTWYNENVIPSLKGEIAPHELQVSQMIAVEEAGDLIFTTTKSVDRTQDFVKTYNRFITIERTFQGASPTIRPESN